MFCFTRYAVAKAHDSILFRKYNDRRFPSRQVAINDPEVVLEQVADFFPVKPG